MRSAPAAFLPVGSIALVNSIANLGGFPGPVLAGVIRERTGGYAAVYTAVAMALMLAATMVVVLGRAMSVRGAATQSAA